MDSSGHTWSPGLTLGTAQVCQSGGLRGLAGVWTSSLYKASVSQGGGWGGETYGPTGSSQAP